MVCTVPYSWTRNGVSQIDAVLERREDNAQTTKRIAGRGHLTGPAIVATIPAPADSTLNTWHGICNEIVVAELYQVTAFGSL